MSDNWEYHLENKKKLLKQLKEKLKTEFDTGYKLGVKESKGEIDKLREKLKIAVDALEFYADKDMYKQQNQTNYTCVSKEDREYIIERRSKHYHFKVGGKTARQALEKIGENNGNNTRSIAE